MARVAVYVPDLLFASNVLAQLSGHDASLVSDAGRLDEALPGTEVIVVDLTADAQERIEQVRARRPEGARVLAFYSHVETDVREQARGAGFELVIPRSRMAREGSRLLDQLLAG